MTVLSVKNRKAAERLSGFIYSAEYRKTPPPRNQVHENSAQCAVRDSNPGHPD